VNALRGHLAEFGVIAPPTMLAQHSRRWMEARNPGDGERWTLFASVTEPSQLV